MEGVGRNSITNDNVPSGPTTDATANPGAQTRRAGDSRPAAPCLAIVVRPVQPQVPMYAPMAAIRAAAALGVCQADEA